MDREYEKMLELLLRSLDETLSPGELEQLTEALRQSDRLRQEKATLLKMRQQLAEWQPAEDTGFSARVMQQLGKQAEEDLSAVIVRLFPRVAAACVVVLFLALGGIYYTEGNLMVENIIGVNEMLMEDAIILVDNGY